MLKKLAGYLAIAFVIFYVVTAPSQAADAVESTGDGLRRAGDSVATFFNDLFS